MTRREEIENHIVYQQTIAAFEYANQHFEDIHKISERNAAFNGFEAGAEWMQKKMIEKAYEWILSNTPKYVKVNKLDVFINNLDMASDFRKAMED